MAGPSGEDGVVTCAGPPANVCGVAPAGGVAVAKEVYAVLFGFPTLAGST